MHRGNAGFALIVAVALEALVLSLPYWVDNILYLSTFVSAVAPALSALIFCLKWPVPGAERFTCQTVASLVLIFLAY